MTLNETILAEINMVVLKLKLIWGSNNDIES